MSTLYGDIVPYTEPFVTSSYHVSMSHSASEQEHRSNFYQGLTLRVLFKKASLLNYLCI